ncbi:ATP-dependent DNA ligase [Lutibaculum baratangense]|nr:ATP-dependent DNA ligase [Lutibaculum baratangense]
MEAKRVQALPDGAGWQFEPKWDGFRCLAFRQAGAVELRAKSGKDLARYFPEIVAELLALAPDVFAVDGELVVPQGETLSFDALQMRLHPAESRVRRLSAETPARFILFDMLMDVDGASLLERPLIERRERLEAFCGAVRSELLDLSPYTRERDVACRWLEHTGAALDGVVAKPLEGPYEAGERAMYKVKVERTADCVVGGFRYGTNSAQAGSLLLGLHDEEGKLDHVGFCPVAAGDRDTLTKRLEKLVEPPGFTGKAPGGPSRWSNGRSAEWQPLRPELVVEVRYDQVTGGRFRHGTKLMRWRPDKAPRQCTMEQLVQEAEPARLIDDLEGARP